MSLSKQEIRLLAISLSLLILGTSCVHIQNATTCSPAGLVSAGGICSHLLDEKTHNLSFKELIDFLEPQQDRNCVPVEDMGVCRDDQTTGVSVMIPARAGAIAMSAQDWGQMKMELEQACRLLGSRCTLGIKTAIARWHE